MCRRHSWFTFAVGWGDRTRTSCVAATPSHACLRLHTNVHSPPPRRQMGLVEHHQGHRAALCANQNQPASFLADRAVQARQSSRGRPCLPCRITRPRASQEGLERAWDDENHHGPQTNVRSHTATPVFPPPHGKHHERIPSARTASAWPSRAWKPPSRLLQKLLRCHHLNQAFRSAGSAGTPPVSPLPASNSAQQHPNQHSASNTVHHQLALQLMPTASNNSLQSQMDQRPKIQTETGPNRAGLGGLTDTKPGYEPSTPHLVPVYQTPSRSRRNTRLHYFPDRDAECDGESGKRLLITRSHMDHAYPPFGRHSVTRTRKGV